MTLADYVEFGVILLIEGFDHHYVELRATCTFVHSWAKDS